MPTMFVSTAARDRILLLRTEAQPRLPYRFIRLLLREWGFDMDRAIRCLDVAGPVRGALFVQTTLEGRR